MRIRKYDFNYSRRTFLDKLAKGTMAAGVLSPLWPLIARAGDITKAYPDELLSIEGYTKGKMKTGDMITADADAITLIFPVWAADYTLESSASLTGTWTEVTAARSEVDEQIHVTVPRGPGAQFFRLVR